LVPLLVAGAVAWLTPQKHGWRVRAPLAVIAALFALFVARMWPSAIAAAPAEEGAAGPPEMHTPLSLLLRPPPSRAVAVRFMRRQAPRLLKATTLLIMLGTLFACVPLLSVDMGRTYHFNHDVVWIARFGIHYHVALDGISLWLVILTTLITPIATYVS